MKPLTNYFPILVISLLAAINLASCVNSKVEETAITLGEEFSLALGEKTSIPSEDLTLQFLGVPVDDRCPTQVECEYSGQAFVEIEVVTANRDSILLEFNTNPWPDINLQIITELGYVFELIRLDPYPEQIDNPIQAEDYRAVMVVRSE